MTFKELRALANMGIAEIGHYFGIPYRTVQDWEYGKNKPADYLLALMEYKLRKEKILK